MATDDGNDNMAKSKHAHSGPTGRGRGHRHGAGKKKGRVPKAQTRRGLLVTDDTLTRPESIVSVLDDEDEDDEEQNSLGPNGAPPLLFYRFPLHLPQMLRSLSQWQCGSVPPVPPYNACVV